MTLATDPLDILLDEEGDLLIVDGDLALSSGISGVAQEVRIAVLLFRGEWFLDLDAGVPYFEDVLGRKFSAPLIAEAFRGEILKVPDVVEILALDVEFDAATRQLTVAWQVRTAFGDTDPDSIMTAVSGGVVP